MNTLRTILAATLLVGTVGGAAVSAQAQDWHHGWHRDHHDWRARRAWRWRHHWGGGYYGYYAPPGYYGYYNPPPYYGQY